MKQAVFDFATIKTMDDFYTEAFAKFQFPEYFGNNLDALWDSLTGGIELPVDISFVNLSTEQTEQFYDLIILMEDAAIALEEDLYFEYSLRDEQEDLFFNGIEL